MKRREFNEDWLFGIQNGEKEVVVLPHDAMQEHGREAKALSGSGGAFYRGGCYEYEKKFWAPKEWKEQDVIIEFEGVAPNATVFLNQIEIARCAYGYSLFRVALELLKYEAYNELNVVADNSELPNSRWYYGAGIYRPVWLWIGEKVHIHPAGIRVTTLSYDPAQILVEVEHTGKKLKDEDVKVEIFYQNEKVAEGQGNQVKIDIQDAQLWDADSPNLYQCKVTLKDGEKVIDTQSVTFGIRRLAWSTDGFTVNGKNVLLKGGCIHHDNGILGARGFDKSEWRRVERLKESGFNAIRSAHNPASRAVLEACDTLGMYVMDETWDMWYAAKNKYDYAKDFYANYEKDIAAIVSKDYNHPSVIMYSIGNEVTEPAKEEGIELAKKIKEHFHSIDNTRPITAGINLSILLMASFGMNLSDVNQEKNETEVMNSTVYNEMVNKNGSQLVNGAASDEADRVTSPILDLLDIAGYNYASSRYEIEGEKNPHRIVVGSETFPQDLVNNWRQVEKHPYLIGDFMWTAWDYLGEVGLGAWAYEPDGATFHKKYPWLLADAGAFDILGNGNAEAGLAAVVWDAKKSPYIGVVPLNHPGVIPSKSMWRGSNALPYWSYQNCEGNPAEIEVYSKADSIELFINDKSIGNQKLNDYKAVFLAKYEPGTLKAIAYDENGMIHSESMLHSADHNTQICILPEEKDIKKGEILYLDISLRGNNGEVECNRDTCLEVNVVGGDLLGFGSANPRTEESFLDGRYTTYYGRSQAVVKVKDKELKISVTGINLSTSILNIQVED